MINKFYFISFENYSYIQKVLKHELCECFADSSLYLRNLNENNYEVLFGDKRYNFNSKNLTLTCDLYKSLKRGLNQKVVAYSLYGTNDRYYKLISHTSEMVKKFYPDHVMRIYHDDSINKSIICQLECANPHIDFCNIHKLPLSLENFNQVLNLNYIHSMEWRFLPIGDTFVDLFHSRDSDSMILQREYDSVQEWLNSDNIGHIMRDHPQHGTHILGGMWGLKTNQDRKLSNEVYNIIIDKKLSQKYNPGGKSSRGHDQYFLSHHVYDKINLKSTVHDSYLCKKYPNSKPFPTERKGDCFVGRVGWCNETNINFFECPNECRPPNHQDWKSC
ncbi:unnamed protein product [Brachionus calyciflorus]|uniref:Uncharacterized protein n=1 Tax=Brachionus calyciflorus TaxID=104777 RepID=A0A813XK94_9BILA|nr:unnamed protein product [Brachionus calyciflorus]